MSTNYGPNSSVDGPSTQMKQRLQILRHGNLSVVFNPDCTCEDCVSDRFLVTHLINAVLYATPGRQKQCATMLRRSLRQLRETGGTTTGGSDEVDNELVEQLVTALRNEKTARESVTAST